jgi:hypothetical protein
MTTAPPGPHKSARARKTGAARQGKAIRPKPKVRLTSRAREEGDNPGTGHWRTYFLEHLIETSNITASAHYAKTVPSRAYRTRKQDPAFAAAWDAALAEGYRNLEMDLLAYLRSPSPDRKMDVASAIRLLTLHRQAVARSRAEVDEQSEQDVLDSIDAMIDEMRQRASANAALTSEQDTEQDWPDEQA